VTRAISAEFFKLRTTRTSWAVTLGSIALVVIISLIAAPTAEFDNGAPDESPGSDLMQIGGLVQIFALVLGILSVRPSSGTARSRRACWPCRTARGWWPRSS
jgi:hypothetical protein